MRLKGLAIFFCLLLLTACSAQPSVSEPSIQDDQEPSVPAVVEAPEPVEILISAVGDIMVHKMQLDAQFSNSTGEYDFTNNFNYVAPYLQRADLALANLETVFAGQARNFTGYPLFNSPDALADALKGAGFDVISTSNNHTYDRGKDGVIRTIEVLDDRGLGVIGTRATTEDESFLIVDVKGIQVGLSAYTYEGPASGGKKTINGLPVARDAEDLIDSFNYQHLERDLEKMTQRAVLMRESGAEVMVFFMHWGTEYARQPNSYQKQIAEALVDAGVDIIFGSHPHVIQPIELISTASGRQGVAVYSMGNFLSNQRYEFLSKNYTEDGIIVNVSVTKEPDGEIVLGDVSYTPTWVHRYNKGGKIGYNIVPLPDALEDRETFDLYTDDSLRRAQNALKNTTEIVTTNSLSAIPVHSLFEPETYKQ